MVRLFRLIIIFLGLIFQCFESPPPNCLLNIGHGSWDCGGCSIGGQDNNRVLAPCTCTFSCNNGRFLSTPSDPTRYCDATGTWDETKPTCTPSMCAVVIAHGSYDCGGCSTVGTGANIRVSEPCTCTFSCDSGYDMSTPSDTDRECSNTGNWDVARPTCNGGSSCNCPTGYSLYDLETPTSCVKLVDNVVKRLGQAENFCVTDNGGHLVSILSPTKQNWIVTEFNLVNK